jgi:hypothetical protein
VSAKLNADVMHALSFIRAWTEADRWPIAPLTLAARVGVDVQAVENDAEFVARVSDLGDDDTAFYFVWNWRDLAPVRGNLAAHCTQRLLRRCGLDPQDYELVARVCVELTDYLPDRSAIDWMLKVMLHLRGDVA